MSFLYYFLIGGFVSCVTYNIMPYRADPDRLLYGTIVVLWPIFLIIVLILLIARLFELI